MILGGEFYDSVADTPQGSHILRLSAWTVFAGLLFSLAAGLLLFAVLTARLRRLSKVVKWFEREGKFDKAELPLKPAGTPPDENKGDAIDMDVPDGLPFVVADIAMIERVLENLVENAIHIRHPAEKSRWNSTVGTTMYRCESRIRARAFPRKKFPASSKGSTGPERTGRPTPCIRVSVSRSHVPSWGLVLKSAMALRNADAKRPGMHSHAKRGNEAVSDWPKLKPSPHPAIARPGHSR